jgi:hypothetical protein
MTKYLGTEAEVNVIDSAAVVPDDGTVSDVYAIPKLARLLAMSIRPVGTYGAISVSLSISNNATSGFAIIKTSTSTTGEYYTSGALAAKFCKVTVTSSSGASRTGLVVGLLAK